VNAFAAITPANDEITPTERSKPPAMNTSAPPQAMIPTGAAWKARLIRLSRVRKTSLASDSVTKSAMNATTIP
jgi:hypothetical protein